LLYYCYYDCWYYFLMMGDGVDTTFFFLFSFFFSILHNTFFTSHLIKRDTFFWGTYRVLQIFLFHILLIVFVFPKCWDSTPLFFYEHEKLRMTAFFDFNFWLYFWVFGWKNWKGNWGSYGFQLHLLHFVYAILSVIFFIYSFFFLSPSVLHSTCFVFFYELWS